MRKNGKVNYWNHKKGYGFIEPDTGGDTLFVHITSFNTKNKAPTVNSNVTFELGEGRDGRPCAINVLQEGEKAVSTNKPNQAKSNQATSNQAKQSKMPLALWLIPIAVIALVAFFLVTK